MNGIIIRHRKQRQKQSSAKSLPKPDCWREKACYMTNSTKSIMSPLQASTKHGTQLDFDIGNNKEDRGEWVL